MSLCPVWPSGSAAAQIPELFAPHIRPYVKRATMFCQTCVKFQNIVHFLIYQPNWISELFASSSAARVISNTLLRPLNRQKLFVEEGYPEIIFSLTFYLDESMIRAIKNFQTAEVKVKTIMRAQRVRGAGSRTEMQVVTMGHRGRGKRGIPPVACDVEGRRYPAGSMLVLC